jgi:hypothetical protein
MMVVILSAGSAADSLNNPVTANVTGPPAMATLAYTETIPLPAATTQILRETPAQKIPGALGTTISPAG